MPRLLYIYIASRIVITALLIETSLCVPVVLTKLFQYLPASAVRGGLFMPALFGTLPTVLYIALPMAIGVAIALEFARMSSDGMIAVLYSLRLSVWSICVPGAVVGGLAVVLGYWVSLVVAPTYVGQMHDVIYVIRNSLNHRLLEPAQFYNFDNGARTLYFQRWRSADVVSGMFIHQFSADKQEEQIIAAAETEFRRNENGVVLIMTNGSLQSRPINSPEMRTANFDEYVMTLDLQGNGAMPKRNWRGVFELSSMDFFRSRPASDAEPRQYAEWVSEAVKRLGIPLLALVHSLLGIGLVLTVSSATGRGSSAATLVILAVPAVHIVILIGAETLVRQDPRLAWLIYLAMAAEFIVALAMIHRQNANSKPVNTNSCAFPMRRLIRREAD
jgi:lipopolysaccharide export system permease protein